MKGLNQKQLEALQQEPITKQAMKETGLTFDEMMAVQLTVPSEDISTISNWSIGWSGVLNPEYIPYLLDFAILRWFYSPEAWLPGNEEAQREAKKYILSQDRGIGAARDQRRQLGTRKERRPEITDWIIKQLNRRPDVKSPELWADAPDWITDDIGYDAFSKRVTKGRKKLDGRK